MGLLDLINLLKLAREGIPTWVRQIPGPNPPQDIIWPIYDAKCHGPPYVGWRHRPEGGPAEPLGPYNWADFVQFAMYVKWTTKRMVWMGDGLYAGSASMGTGTDVRQKPASEWSEPRGTHSYAKNIDPGEWIKMGSNQANQKLIIGRTIDGASFFVLGYANPKVVTKEECIMQEGPGVVVLPFISLARPRILWKWRRPS